MSRQDDSDFVLLNKAKDLYVYTSEAVGNDKIIPRRRFRIIGQRLESLALDIYSKTQLANEKNRERDFAVRQSLQDEVIALCLTFEGLVNALKASTPIRRRSGLGRVWMSVISAPHGATMSGNAALHNFDISHGADLHRAVNWWLRSSNSSNNNNAYNANNCARPALACKYAEIQ